MLAGACHVGAPVPPLSPYMATGALPVPVICGCCHKLPLVLRQGFEAFEFLACHRVMLLNSALYTKSYFTNGTLCVGIGLHNIQDTFAVQRRAKG